MEGMAAIKDAVVSRFLTQIAAFPGYLTPADAFVIDNPTEEIVAGIKRGRPVKLFARGVRRPGAPAPRPQARLEENYLYSSRRFPSSVNNTIGAGAVAVNTYPFFGVASGGNGDALGFPTGFVLSANETNMEMGGQIPQGQSFVFNQLGLSLNADAAVADCNQLLEAATLQFSRAGGSFTINQGPLKFWPGGTGNGGQYGSMTAAATNQFGTNGAPDIRAVRNLRIARVLKGNDVFNYALIIPRTTKNTDGTAFALSNFVVCTIWLWGGWKSTIAG